jgi:hypothetical protein
MFKSNETSNNDYIARNFYNPINLKIATGQKKNPRENPLKIRKKNSDIMNVMNIDESNEFETVNYRPKYK